MILVADSSAGPAVGQADSLEEGEIPHQSVSSASESEQPHAEKSPAAHKASVKDLPSEATRSKAEYKGNMPSYASYWVHS